MLKLLKWSGLSFENLLGGLLLMYLLSTAVLEFPLYPAWSHRVQPPELIFGIIILGLLLGVLTQKISIRLSWNGVDTAVLFYLFVNLVSAFFHSEGQAPLEVMGKAYLVAVYFLFRLSIPNRWLDWAVIVKGMEVLAVGLIITTGIGFIGLLLGQENILVTEYADYPYFGTVYRAKGLLQTPSMFISVVNWCFLFLFIDGLFNKFGWQRLTQLIGLLVVGVFSFAKAGLFLAFLMVLGLLWFRYGRKSLLPLLFVTGITATVYLVITNFVYIKEPNDSLIANNFLAVSTIPSTDSSIWLPTCYFAFKKAALELGLNHFWLGVGPGNFIHYLEDLKQLGVYPAHLPLHDPHSVLFGAFAETGILGVLSVLVLIGVAFWHLYRINKCEQFHVAMLIWLIVFIIEGFNGDLMNFRHYWIQFGIIGGLIGRTKS